MSNLNRVALVVPKGDFNHNLLPTFAAALGRAIAARELEVDLLDSTAPGFHRLLLDCLREPSTAVYAGHFFYDLGLVHGSETAETRVNLFAALDRPVFARIADHPFAKFMLPRIEAASPTTHFLMPSLEFEEEVRFLNPALTQFHKVTPSVTLEIPADDEVPPLDRRPIDIFMPCSLKPILPSIEDLRQRYRAAGSPMLAVLEETLETGRTARDRSLMDIFFQAIANRFGARFVVSSPLSDGDREVLLTLSSIDFRIRTQRRLDVLRSLLRLDSGLRIVVTVADSLREMIPQLKDRPNIELIGTVDARRSRELYLSSKYAINVNPTYYGLVSERVRNAMALGCCVISDKSAQAARTFAEGREILYMEDGGLDALSDVVSGDTAETQAIASRGRQHVAANFTIAHLADDILAVMRAVI